MRGVEALDRIRRRLLVKANGEEEVPWAQVIKASRVKPVHPITTARRLAAARKDLKFRRPREKLQRTADDTFQRVAKCKKLERLPDGYFSNEVDFIIDNKTWHIPLSEAAKKHVKLTKVRGHLRTRKEVLLTHCTKPNNRKHRMNVGGSMSLWAGIHKDQVCMWECLPKT